MLFVLIFVDMQSDDHVPTEYLKIPEPSAVALSGSGTVCF